MHILKSITTRENNFGREQLLVFLVEVIELCKYYYR